MRNGQRLWGQGLPANPPEASTRTRALQPVQIIAHLGSTDNQYLQEIAAYWPEGCPECGAEVEKWDAYWRYGGSRAAKVPIYRFRCTLACCRQVFSVLPSYLVPGQSYPAALEEAAVTTYAAGVAPLAGVADTLGIGTTTVFRWVDRVCRTVQNWHVLLQRVLLLLDAVADTTLRLREELRRLWRARRIRRPGKVDQLLLLEQWPPWVQRLRETLATFDGAPPAPGWLGALAFWRQHQAACRHLVSRR